ncbi:anthrax toxin lethal factor-related metalloendopeptidase [Mesobacillus boroniphilus]|uniref:anthrax toxin lethal factor-related metalloendopeptidase n=1 Tax=Mesobacillus boroniphilus TaxID=308892 RepID=UPI003F71E54E
MGLLKNSKILENIELVNKVVSAKPHLQNREEAIKIKKELSGLSLGLLEKLRLNHINVFIVDEPITNFPEFAHLKGIVPKGWENSGKTWDDVPGAGGERRVIIRIGYNDYVMGHGSLSLTLHETAHSIDHYIFNNLSHTEEFQKIWKREASNLFGSHPYYLNYSEEYFAETFAMFYYDETSKQKLKTFAPLTYTLFKNMN